MFEQSGFVPLARRCHVVVVIVLFAVQALGYIMR